MFDNLSRFFLRRTSLLRFSGVFVCLAVVSSPLFAQGYGVYGPVLGFGDALQVARAATGVANHHGASAGLLNPAAYFSEQNEMIIEGAVWGAITLQAGTEPRGFRLGLGSVVYLTRLGKGNLAVGYVPRMSVFGGVRYQHLTHSARLGYVNLEAAYARPLTKTIQWGAAVRWVDGVYGVGAISSGSARIEDLYEPRLVETVVGLRGRGERFTWGAVVTLPPLGIVAHGYPLGFSLSRGWEDLEFSGAPTFRVGLGLKGEESSVEWDGSLTLADGINHDATVFDGEGLFHESGIAFSYDGIEPISFNGGLRARFGAAEANGYLMGGAGGTYTLSPELALQAGAGMLLTSWGDMKDYPIGELYPWVVRMGVLILETEDER